jgi:hypothetical protein
MFVVDESDAVADENFVFDRHAFANETVTRDFAVAADARLFLNLDEGSDGGCIANLATIEIYEVVDFDVAAQFDVRCDDAELSRHESAGSVRQVVSMEMRASRQDYLEAARALSPPSSSL